MAVPVRLNQIIPDHDIMLPRRYPKITQTLLVMPTV